MVSWCWKVLASLKCKVHLVPSKVSRQVASSQALQAGVGRGSDKILQICSTYVFYIFYIFYILYVFYIFYVRKLQPPTTCSPWFQCSTSAIVWCSDQIRSEKRDCSKLWSAKILHWPTSRPGTHLQSMASATFLDCPNPLLFPHVLHPLQNLEKLLNIEQRNLSVLETFTTANKDTEALNPLLLWS